MRSASCQTPRMNSGVWEIGRGVRHSYCVFRRGFQVLGLQFVKYFPRYHLRRSNESEGLNHVLRIICVPSSSDGEVISLCQFHHARQVVNLRIVMPKALAKGCGSPIVNGSTESTRVGGTSAERLSLVNSQATSQKGVGASLASMK
jgi:hypothetical protein